MVDRKQFDSRRIALEQALQAKLGLRGKSLRLRLNRAGRLLPKRLHAEGRYLVQAQEKLSHPRLSQQVDHARVAKAFDAFDEHLKTIDPRDRRRGKLVGWLAGLVANLIALAALVVLLLRWQGVI